MSNKLFEIKIIQPNFDEVFAKYEEKMTTENINNPLLKELSILQTEMTEAYRGGRKNGQVMIDVLNKILPLLKRVDTESYKNFKLNLDNFTHYYGVNMMYGVGDTFIPYLKACINSVNQTVTGLEFEEKFPTSKEQETEQKEKDISGDKQYDVFISHASEDKDVFVRPLAEALQSKGISVWYDEFELGWGDKLREKIDEGLNMSKFGIVVLSKSFFEKEWPKNELEGLFARDTGGVKVILPILHEVKVEEVREFSPMLAGRLARKSGNAEIPRIVTELQNLLNRDKET